LRLSANSTAFTLLLGALAALPSFGIDMSLPALGSIGASLDVSAGRAGLTMSLFMVGFAIAPPFCGPVSDRVGRKPIVLGAVALFAAASLGCTAAHSLPALLAWRVVQGMGAGVGMTTALAIIRDLFDGAAGRAKLSYVASLMLFIPTIAPAAGTAMLTVGSWRSIYGLLAGIGLVLLCILGLYFRESARMDNAERLSPAAMLRDYAHVLTHPTCLGYIIVNAAGFGALFAYVSGSSLFFIDAVGLSRGQYSLVFAATSIGIMMGAFVNGRLSEKGVATAYPLGTGVALALASSLCLLAAIVAGWIWVPGLAGIFVVATMAFGLIAPNATYAAMQPLPDHAGTVSAVAGSVQVLTGSASSVLVVSFGGWHPGLSMAVSMVFWSALALLAHLGLARLAGRREAGFARAQT
jgi:MFS transporter, DHA1 family, multidrug resistance protein